MAVYPAPSWQHSADPAKDSEFYRNQNGSSFILEQIPKGEKFEKWSRLYAIAAVKVEGLTLKDFINRSLAPFYNACGKENFFVTPLQQSAESVLLHVLCQNSPAGPAKFGYGDGVGEITVMRFGQVGSTLIKVYQHWRGKSFIATDTSTWPVPKEEVGMMMNRFTTIRFVGKPGR
ncbi:hypothetical protein [Ferrovibrio xuzhouensis]|uniref:Uncharacterized protein n=1 Tax=Ferrovibrio xuzhouensis TaxID=1576914 RepID=A0ABV7V9Q0_9PROT